MENGQIVLGMGKLNPFKVIEGNNRSSGSGFIAIYHNTVCYNMGCYVLSSETSELYAKKPLM